VLPAKIVWGAYERAPFQASGQATGAAFSLLLDLASDSLLTTYSSC
jgi:hypothetical protein